MFDAAKQYQEYAKEYQRFFSNAGAPSVNVGKISQLNQELASAYANANKIVVDAAQRFAKSQSDFIQEQAQKAANAATKAVSAKTPEEGLESQTKFAQEAFDANVQNIQSAAKSASEAAVKIFDVINKQTVEYLSELSRVAQNS
jgi:hypothetical protein